MASGSWLLVSNSCAPMVPRLHSAESGLANRPIFRGGISFMLRRFALTALIVSLISIHVGCGDSGSSSENDSGSPRAGDGANPNGDAAREELVYAKDWQDIYMSANSAKTTIDTSGHFVTTRNACGLDGWGSLEVKDWNEFANIVNAAVAAPVGSQQCFAATEAWPSMDGFAEVRLEFGQKRNLLETMNGQICTTITDTAAAQKLYAALNKMILVADCAQCTTSWAPARCTEVRTP